MASILKVDKIRVTGNDSDSISFNNNGNITLNKNVTVNSGTLGSSVVFPAGCIIQTVTMGHGTTTQISASSATTVLSSTITPKFSNSKIMILGAMQLHPDDAGSYWMIRLLRGSTQIVGGLFSAIGYQTAAGVRDHMAIHHIDSPSTTSATTYNISVERSSGSGTIRVNYSDYGSMTFMEIAQ